MYLSKESLKSFSQKLKIFCDNWSVIGTASSIPEVGDVKSYDLLGIPLIILRDQEKNVKVSQPIAGQHQPSQADTLDTSQLLPSNRGLTSIPQQNNPDFNDMYQNTVNPLQGAAAPQQNEPIAANDGGSMFGSW